MKTSLSRSEIPYCMQSGDDITDGDRIPSLSGAAQFSDLYYTPLVPWLPQAPVEAGTAGRRGACVGRLVKHLSKHLFFPMVQENL